MSPPLPARSPSSRLPPRPVLLAALAALALALAWWLGHRAGFERGFGEGVERGAAGAENAAAGQAAQARAANEATLAALRHERDAARATIASLTERLARADSLDAAERAELALYRRIGDEEMPGGLVIDAVERRAGEPGTLAVTLVQARGRERVSGRLEATLLPADGEGARPLGETDFDLRFFATLELPLAGLDDGAPPVAVVLEVTPEGSRHTPFRERIEWDSIRIVD